MFQLKLRLKVYFSNLFGIYKESFLPPFPFIFLNFCNKYISKYQFTYFLNFNQLEAWKFENTVILIHNTVIIYGRSHNLHSTLNSLLPT